MTTIIITIAGGRQVALSTDSSMRGVYAKAEGIDSFGVTRTAQGFRSTFAVYTPGSKIPAKIECRLNGDDLAKVKALFAEVDAACERRSQITAEEQKNYDAVRRMMAE